MTAGLTTFADEFDGPDLDRAVWVPNYLPHWSSRAASAASYDFADGALRLFIPPGQGLWCADTHQPPIRVSGIQSGSWSGPVGSTVGPQPYRDGAMVREAQESFWGWTPSAPCTVEIRLRGVVTARSMVALWMSGLEVEPYESGEICVTEMFGSSVVAGESVEVGMGVKQLRDPDAVHDFAAPRLPIDIAEWHTYAVHWTAEKVDYLVDGELIRTTRNPPIYPMQLMLAVFDFPEWSTGSDDEAVPELWVDYIRGSSAAL